MLFLEFMENENGSWGRQYLLEDVFGGDFDVYLTYLLRALSLCQDGAKKRKLSLAKFVPTRIGVEFEKGLKAPQFDFPRFKGIMMVQLPDQGLSPRKKAVQREATLKKYSSLVKRNEIAMADEIAIRMRVLEQGSESKSKRFSGK